MYAYGNPLNYVDPSGHETNKPEWWPDYLPYTFDLPDGMTRDEFMVWLGENNIPTTWGIEVGGSGTFGPFFGTTASLEGIYIFNWLTGETVLGYTQSGGGYVGTPDLGLSVHGGGLIVAGASNIEDSILGFGKYRSGYLELEAFPAEIGTSGTWTRGIYNAGNDDYWFKGPEFIDPEFERTVDMLSVDANLGIDITSIPLQVPEVPVDVGGSAGLSRTEAAVSFNLYSPFRWAGNLFRRN